MKIQSSRYLMRPNALAYYGYLIVDLIISIIGIYVLLTSIKLYGVFVIMVGMGYFLYYVSYQIDIVGNKIILTSFLSKKEIDISNIVDVSFEKKLKGPGYRLLIYDDNKCFKRPLVVILSFYKKNDWRILAKVLNTNEHIKDIQMNEDTRNFLQGI